YRPPLHRGPLAQPTLSPRMGQGQPLGSCPVAHPPLDWPEYRSTRLRAPRRPPVPLGADEPEIAPLRASAQADLTTGGPIGERITVGGRVLDSDGRPVRDALVEVWQ